MPNPIYKLRKRFCRNNTRCYKFDLRITRNGVFLINGRKLVRTFITSLLIISSISLYFGIFNNHSNNSPFQTNKNTHPENVPDCTTSDFQLGEETCNWNIDMPTYRHTFFSPLHHIQIDLYNFQCSNGMISFFFDLSYYSKKWFVNQQIEIITSNGDICLSTMIVCENRRCDKWKPIGHVQSIFSGLSTVVNIHLNMIIIEFRLFENMFAYRSTVRSQKNIDFITLNTRFNISKSSNGENIDGNAFMDGGEEVGFMKFDITDRAETLAKTWAKSIQHLPWTLDLHTINDRIVISIIEACNFGSANARMSFSNYDYFIRSSLLLKLTYQYGINKDQSNGGLQWTTWLLADSPKRLADLAGFAGLLCPSPSKTENFSWIRPGKVGRDMSLSTITTKSLMNFAQSANLDYILLDAGYYGDEYNVNSDPNRPLFMPRENPLNISELVEYGKSLSKPVGLILYVNDIFLSKGIEFVTHLAETFQSWGIAGIKMGFVQSKNQLDMERIIKNIEIFGRKKMIVNVHDNFRDFYLSRTYPYLLSVEGVSGDEHVRNPSNHVLILPFTRYLAGRADHTFTLDWSRLKIKNETIMFQIALPYLLYNGLQHLFWYRDSDSLLRLGIQPPLNLWAELPIEYETSIFLAGEIGLYASVVRQDKRGRWFLTYISILAKSVIISWNFLPQSISNYTLTIHEDIEQNYVIPRHVLPRIRIRRCRTTSQLQLNLLINGAFIIIIEPRIDINIEHC